MLDTIAPLFRHSTIASGPLVVHRLLSHWYLLLIGGLIGAAVGYAGATAIETRYAATTTVLVRQASAPTATLATNTMRAVIANHQVAEAVVKKLALTTTPARLLQSLVVSDVPGTYLMRITVADRDPAVAARAANAVAQEAIAFNDRITNGGDEKLQRIMQTELAAARQRMIEAEGRLTEFRGRQRRGGAPLHLSEIEGARLHADLDLATRLYEEIAVQYGKLRLQVAEQAAELLVIEEAHPPETPVARPVRSRVLLGGISGFMLALFFGVLVAVFAPVRPPHP